MAELSGSARTWRRPRRCARVPVISEMWLRWFTMYGRFYLRRHFHSLRIHHHARFADSHGLPLVIYLNHASWWDPLICLFLKEQFLPERRAFAPIEEAMLDRYRFFRRLGFFPVEQRSRRGAEQFLESAFAILEDPEHVLFITPQSRFADIRERPVQFAQGLGHLARRVNEAVFLPLALEYAFWNERFGEVLVSFGEPVRAGREVDSSRSAKSWTEVFEGKLAEAQDSLAAASQSRDPARFQQLLAGRGGISPAYDAWRRLRAYFTGEPLRQEHAAL